MGGTMRLGLYPCQLTPGTQAAAAYGGAMLVQERHRHRFEVNNAYRDLLASAGMIFSGLSPDGRLVAFRRSLGPSPGVYVVTAEGRAAWLVVDGRSPSWHPGGNRIAYSHGGRIGTAAVDVDGRRQGDPVLLTGRQGAVDDYPCWSPDGSCLVFERESSSPDASEAHILTMRADGGGIRDLGEGHTPAWSPVVAQ